MQAAGRMGWSQEQFWFSTPRFFQNAYFGWVEQQRENNIERLRASRLLAFYSFLPHTKKGSLLTPKSLFSLPDEVPPQIEADEKMTEHMRLAKGVDFFAGESIKKSA